MSLTQALSAALSGLRATQSSLALVASNIANVNTPGYARKTPVLIETVAGEAGTGVRVANINRQLDEYVLRQLQVETSGASYAGVRAEFYDRLQQIYGSPGAEGALETVFNSFTSALQTLATTPESTAARSSVLSNAQVLAAQLNGMSADIQALRSDAEFSLSDAVRQANEAMQAIARINQQLGATAADDPTAAGLLDQRDSYVNMLAQLMDIRVVEGDHRQINVFTTAGLQLVGLQASQLAFDARGTITPTNEWSSDPAERSVGTIVLTTPNGAPIDAIANKAIRSGRIAALLDMRDNALPAAQSQLDAVAAAMASALSDVTTDGAAVTVGPQAGFEVDVAGMLAGNTVSLAYTETGPGTQHRVTIVRVDDPLALPLSNSATADPTDEVIGIDFSGGMASVVAQLNAALGPAGLQFSNPSGTLLRALDDGAAGTTDVDAMSVTTTAPGLTGGLELPFFLDGNDLYTGEINSVGPQSVGLSGRIRVNPALNADPSRLVVYQTSPATSTGDPARPNFIFDRLTNMQMTFAPSSAGGGSATAFNGSLPSYLREIISQQGDAAQVASRLKEGQDIVVNNLQQRFNETSGVNIDAEMANLLTLQTSYSANARVMTAVRDMLALLMQL
jgi:flagellar hook-associated protein 1 FlgK